jgi:hypothetical protein
MPKTKKTAFSIFFPEWLQYFLNGSNVGGYVISWTAVSSYKKATDIQSVALKLF